MKTPDHVTDIKVGRKKQKSCYSETFKRHIRSTIERVRHDGVELGAGDYVDLDDLKNICDYADGMLNSIEFLESRLAQVERERDSMMPVFIREMKKYGCSTCEHYIPAAYTQECLGCGNAKLLHWKWNGIWPENTKEEPQK